VPAKETVPHILSLNGNVTQVADRPRRGADGALVLTDWLNDRERHANPYLSEENGLLRRQLGGGRLILGG
jgi:hypothetical protein